MGVAVWRGALTACAVHGSGCGDGVLFRPSRGAVLTVLTVLPTGARVSATSSGWLVQVERPVSGPVYLPAGRVGVARPPG